MGQAEHARRDTGDAAGRTIEFRALPLAVEPEPQRQFPSDLIEIDVLRDVGTRDQPVERVSDATQ